MHYQVEWNGSIWTYDYYDDIDYVNPNQNSGVGDFIMRGHYAYRVPGDFAGKFPNTVLRVLSGNTACPDCYGGLDSVTIGIKFI
jgi:hypothetical protein